MIFFTIDSMSFKLVLVFVLFHLGSLIVPSQGSHFSGGDPDNVGIFIIQGEQTDITDVPYQCVFRISAVGGSFLCGCAIINEKFALTAGHCVEDIVRRRRRLRAKTCGSSRLTVINFQRSEGTITVGVNSLHEQGQSFSVKKAIQHENYKMEGYMSSDIALVLIDGTFSFSDRVKPIDLNSYDIPDGTRVFISGYGETSPKGKVSSNFATGTLMGTYVTTINFEQCKRSYRELGIIIDDTFICAIGSPKRTVIPDSCQGDSGGPLVSDSKDKLLGLVSFGLGCGDSSQPAPCYTKVAKFYPWIQEKMRTLPFDREFRKGLY